MRSLDPTGVCDKTHPCHSTEELAVCASFFDGSGAQNLWYAVNMDGIVGDGVVDVKHMARPRAFDGSKIGEPSPREWKFGFHNFMMLVDSGFIAEMTVAQESADPIFLAARETLAIKRDLTQHAVIASLTPERSSRVIQGIRDRHGYEAHLDEERSRSGCVMWMLMKT